MSTSSALTPSAADSTRCLATAPAGSFVGAEADGVRVWRGIRYAEPTIGAQRWRAPVAAAPAGGEVDATAFGPACPQQANPAVPLDPNTAMSEDCLSLNVFSLDRLRARPGSGCRRRARVAALRHGDPRRR